MAVAKDWARQQRQRVTAATEENQYVSSPAGPGRVSIAYANTEFSGAFNAPAEVESDSPAMRSLRVDVGENRK